MMKKMTRGWLASSMLMAAMLVGCGPDDPATPPGPDAGTDAIKTDGGDAGELVHNEVLDKLGVKTKLGPLKGVNGKPVSKDYNPLTRKRRTLRPLSEIFMAGAASPAGIRQMLRGDLTEGYALVNMGTVDDTYASYPKVSTKGDLDGDGREEVALLVVNNDVTSADYKKIYLHVVEDKAEKYAAKDVPIATLTDAEMSRLKADLASPYLKLDIGAADVDGDGKDEIFATCASTLWVLDDRKAKDSYGVLLTKTFAKQLKTTQFLRVAGGDTSGDGRAELVVVDGQTDSGSGSVTYHIYDDLVEKTSGTAKVETSSIYELMTADVAVGDVDGDQLGEVVFSGRQAGMPTKHLVLVMDDAQAGYAFLKTHHEYTPLHPNVMLVHRVETGDFDGDGAAEIVSFDQILDDLKTKTSLTLVASLPGFPSWGAMLAVGDVTNDHKDDIVYKRGDSTDARVMIHGADGNNYYKQQHEIDVADNLTYMTLTTVNTDDDSALLEFQGHEVRFTDPRILAVMAAPPHYKEIKTDNVMAGTTFGKQTSTGVEKSTSLGLSVGYSSTVEGRYVAVSGSVTTSLETAFDRTTTKSKQLERAYYYTSTSASDKVVFTAVPFDVYYYKILASPLADEVGKHMVVNIPREPQTLFVDRQFFNANNGHFADIDSSVLSHTIGDPRTYPHEAGVDKAGIKKSGGFYSGKMTVGQGMGYQTATISATSSSSVSMGFDLNVKVEIQAGLDFDIAIIAAKAKAGPSFGFHYGFNYTVSTSKTAHFAGNVGNIIDGDDWTKNRFDFGVYVQPITFQNQKFPIIGYWVD